MHQPSADAVPTGLLAPVVSLKLVGETRAKELRALGVATLGDLLDYLPRAYRFESEEREIEILRPNEIQSARGEVTAVDYRPGPRPRFSATLSNGPQRLSLVFFQGGYLRRKLHPGMQLRVTGKVQFFRDIPQMVNPKWETVDDQTARIAESRIRPIYPASGDCSSDVIAAVVKANLDAALAAAAEWFDPALLARRKLLGRAEAYRLIHQPATMRDAEIARRRLVYDELMLLQLALAIGKRMRTGRLSAPVLRIDKTLDARIGSRFPYAFTAAQRRVVLDIVADCKSGRPMNRLIQGDVGSGKTAVAVYAMLAAIANKLQAALLAPTEVLAEQHFFTLQSLLAGSSVNVGLFTGRSLRKRDKSLTEQLEEGRLHIAVGTQALLGGNVKFANLGLVVIDEQHRLGVLQRANLMAKGSQPHYLVMTATPIPRTLALSYFADFDLSVIDELPPGRQPIETRWVSHQQANLAYDAVRAAVEQGRQAYCVMPQIEQLADGDAASVNQELKRLVKGPLSGLRLAALHGQLKAEEKQSTMAAFRAGKIDVLIATTMIEVGIDVPNATVMLIQNADRFGLAQLHQLRGRVGRGSEASLCLLLSDSTSPDAQARLSAMVKTTNGFDLAELDLELRGPGEFFGSRQHGLPELQRADLSAERRLLAIARDDAKEILDADPQLQRPEHAALRHRLIEQFGGQFGFAQVG
jgi:ATP-dependent DNA helicase RecG